MVRLMGVEGWRVWSDRGFTSGPCRRTRSHEFRLDFAIVSISRRIAYLGCETRAHPMRAAHLSEQQ